MGHQFAKKFVDEYERQRRERRDASESYRRVVLFGRGVKALRRDFQADENEDREDGRLRDDRVHVAEIAKHPRATDKQRRGQRVAGLISHTL